MPGRTGGPITELLHAVSRGDGAACDRLWTLIYDELHHLAHSQLAGDAARRWVQPTTLVHEAYLRLCDDEAGEWANRRHFFAAAAEAMRRIRVDDARRRGRLKRGGPGTGKEARRERERQPPRAPTPQGESAVHDPDPAELLAVDEALEKLKRTDARKADVVLLRFFAGLTVEEAAAVLDISPRTVENEWRFARAWLYQELSGE